MDLTIALRDAFGFDAFRPGQEDAVRAALSRKAGDLRPAGAGAA